MDVEIAEDGERAMRKLRYERPDVAVVDLMLPGVDGWRITETLRGEGIETPIVIVSARGSQPDNAHALQIDGADAGLTPTEFRLLYVLASEQGRALTRDQLQQRVWGMPHRHRDRTVDV